MEGQGSILYKQSQSATDIDIEKEMQPGATNNKCPDVCVSSLGAGNPSPLLTLAKSTSERLAPFWTAKFPGETTRRILLQEYLANHYK